MCTVTYVPLGGGVLLGSNRDESIHRGRTLSPAQYTHAAKTLIYPKDEKGKGTWIAATETGSIAVLLNGARKRHSRKPAYRHSRGLIIPDILSQKDPVQALEEFPLSGIEPFTLVLFHQQTLSVFRWDEYQLEKENPDTRQAHCWNSMTLYSPDMEKNNQAALRNLSPESWNLETLRLFHEQKRYEYQLPADSTLHQIQTISISQVSWIGGKLDFHYED